MEDLLKLKNAQIEALQRELDAKVEQLNEAKVLLLESLDALKKAKEEFGLIDFTIKEINEKYGIE